MANLVKPLLSPRKMPKQARSSGVVAAILEAAVRVLEQQGAGRFTAARVAEKAGISVGSLYQYFPNKAAILFQLQSEEWERTARQWRDILKDSAQPPHKRLRMLVHVFLQSECDEAAVRGALNDAAPLLRDGPGTQNTGGMEDAAMEDLMREALPNASDAARWLAADLVEVTLTQVGEHFSGQPRSSAEIKAYADALADMFESYLYRIEGRKDV